MSPKAWSAILIAILVAGPVPGCRSERTPRAAAPVELPGRGDGFLDTLQQRTFDFFWERVDPRTGLTPDRWPTRSFASVSAVGFALTAYPIGAERGYVSREEAAERVLRTLRWFWRAPQDSSAAAPGTGYRGLFYHFLDMESGRRFADVELSTIDTALFLAGALFCQSYFDRPVAVEDSIRAYAERLYLRADWRWAQVRPPAIAHGWTPESGHLPYDWRGYDEAMILQVLALASPTHPPTGDVWAAWVSGYEWGDFYGYEHLAFGPLFGHQFSHVWLDFRGIQDAYMKQRGIDYFENSRRAVLSQHAYAKANPAGWAEYGERFWGLSACDGPFDGTLRIDGREREFHTYWARGASLRGIDDDGTICPSAVAGSLPFAPEIVLPTLRSMRARHGDRIFSLYGFLDALNPTLTIDIPVHHGQVVPGVGWFDTDYLGIDQGPILAMAENHRSGLVWRTMRRNPHVIRGLRAAGFGGGWLDSIPSME
jgi:hypothetical protein